MTSIEVLTALLCASHLFFVHEKRCDEIVCLSLRFFQLSLASFFVGSHDALYDV